MQVRNHFIITVSLMLTAIIGCTETVSISLSSVTEADDAMVGIITRIDNGQFGMRILVEENVKVKEPLEPGGKKTWYTISEQSELFSQAGNNLLNVIREDELKKGQIVKAWSSGIMMTSYPGQTGAKRIIVLHHI